MIARVSPTGGAQASRQEATTTRQHGGWRRGRGCQASPASLPCLQAAPSLEGKGERESARLLERSGGRESEGKRRGKIFFYRALYITGG
jgi:hypothetical protein